MKRNFYASFFEESQNQDSNLFSELRFNINGQSENTEPENIQNSNSQIENNILIIPENKNSFILRKVGFSVAYLGAFTLSLIISGLLGCLAIVKNKNNPTLAGISFASALAGTVLSSFYFFINMGSIVRKLRDRKYGAPFRISFGLGFLLAGLNTVGGLKIAIDVIYDNPFEFVQQLGGFGVGILSAYNMVSLTYGATEGLFTPWYYFRQFIHREWSQFRAFFNLVEDLTTYGPLLGKSHFRYDPKESIVKNAEHFYRALYNLNIKPMRRSSRIFLKAMKAIITPFSVYFSLMILPVWMKMGEMGFNALGKYFNSENLVGNELPGLDLLSAMGSQLLYSQFAAALTDFLFDAFSLPLRAGLATAQNAANKTSKKAIYFGLGALSIGVGATLLGIGWFSGGGMAAVASESVATNYGALANSTLFEIIRAPSKPFESILGDLMGSFTGLVNMSATLGIVKKLFYSGPIFYTDENSVLGVNNFAEELAKISETRNFSVFGKNEAEQQDSMNALDRAREFWTKQRDFTWMGFFKPSSINQHYNLLEPDPNSLVVASASENEARPN